MYNLEFSAASRVFFHRATNPYAEIYFDQQNSKDALLLAAVARQNNTSGIVDTGKAPPAVTR
jgi:hypothetical protein